MDDQALVNRQRFLVDEGTNADGSVAPGIDMNCLRRQVQGDSGGSC